MNETQILQAAFEQYDLGHPRTRLLGSLWNRVYRVDASGRVYSLRVCPSVIQNKQSLVDELTWLEFVASQRLVQVPRPVRNQHGELVTTISMDEGERLCCLFEWIEGDSIRNDLRLSVMGQMGQAVGNLHKISRDFGSPAVHINFRANYQYDSWLVASHRDWIGEHEEEIGAECVKLLNVTVDQLIDELIKIGEIGTNYGFIHADLHLGNFLVKDDVVNIIDFDQLGRGHFLYDLAVLKMELGVELADESKFWEKFIEGYRQVAEVPFIEESELQPFAVAVHLAFLDWVYNSQNPKVREQMAERIPKAYASINEWLQAYEKF